MFKKIVLLTVLATSFNTKAQNVVDFESFTLAPNSAFSPSITTSFQTNNVVFPYKWSSTYNF